MDVSAPRARGPLAPLQADDAPADPPRMPERIEREEVPENGLVKRAPRIDPVIDLPEGVRIVRRATIDDAEAIAELQNRCHLSNLEEDAKGGWLLQRSTAESIRSAMKLNKDFWIAENDEGKVVAFQMVTPARLISRPAAKHKFFGPFASRAKRVLASGNFIYMSQVAVDREYRGRKLAPAMQERVLAHYQKRPLVAHVGVCTQQDLDAWDRKGPFEPASNNVASHIHHQRSGYRMVAYTSDLDHSSYNSGLAPPDPDHDEMPAVLGVMYINFRDGAEALPFEYVDPVKAVLDAPVAEGEIEASERSFSKHWPEPDAFDDADPSWSEDRAQRYELAKQRLELLFLREPEV